MQIGKAMSVPPSAILGGLLILTSYVLSPSVIAVPGTDWVEPVLIWLTISMPTGSRKTTIYQFLRGLLQRIRHAAGCSGILQTKVMYVPTYTFSHLCLDGFIRFIFYAVSHQDDYCSVLATLSMQGPGEGGGLSIFTVFHCNDL